jgi:cell division protein FtsW
MQNVMHQRGYYDRMLLFAVLLLIAVSVVMVYSSSSVVALTSYDDATFFMKRQLMWALIGLVLMAITMRIDHHHLSDQRLVIALMVISLILLAATLAPGVGRMVNGSRRWLRLGMLSFQPSEFARASLST